MLLQILQTTNNASFQIEMCYQLLPKPDLSASIWEHFFHYQLRSESIFPSHCLYKERAIQIPPSYVYHRLAVFPSPISSPFRNKQIP